MEDEAHPAQLFLFGVAYKPDSIAQVLYQLINCPQTLLFISCVVRATMDCLLF